MTQSTVLVSGANGFIAQELIYQLLKKGYKVIGLVRSDEKGKKLAKVIDNDNFSYVVVPVLEEKGAFNKVLQEHPEIETFYHTASPVTFSDDDVENNILIPAIHGTKYVLESIKEYAPQLKHFVYTSSVVALFDPLNPQSANEDSWSPITYEQAKSSGTLGYPGSKKFAEEEVWKFRDQFKPDFSISTVLPAFTLGPQTFKANVSNLRSTASFFADAIESKTREEFESKLVFDIAVDIRDVGRAHIFAAENANAYGKRLLLASDAYNADTILTILNEKYPGKTALKANDPVTPPGPNFFDNKRTRALLGNLITPKQSISDSLAQHVEAGSL